MFTLIGGAPALSADLRVLQLESEVRRLQRELDTQARRINELERMSRSGNVPRTPDNSSEPTERSPAWLVSGNWDRLRLGMKITDVIALLGRPTSVRNAADGEVQSLWYAMEIGPNAVLSGNVHLKGAGVTQINKPALR